MKTCGYCGTANDGSSSLCSRCGTELTESHPEVPPLLATSIPPLLPVPKVLDARVAAKTFGIFLTAQIITGFAGGLLAAAAGANPSKDPASLAPVMLASFVIGVLAFIDYVRRQIPRTLMDASSFGAAWLSGRPGALLQGWATGACLGMLALIILALTVRVDADQQLSPMRQIALTPGFPRICWILAILVMAPLGEELLFRGIFFAGMNRSMGPRWAAILTTLTFTALHIPQNIGTPTALLPIGIFGWVALRYRLRFAAIGPAIALHFGYNSVIVATVLIASAHR